MAAILVVEDHGVTLRVLSKRLRDAGHDVRTAENGVEALAQLAQAVPDLVLTDIAMPEMDGLTLLHRIKADPRLRGVPVVMLTTSVLDHHRQEAQAAGAAGFLEKPVSSWDLQAMIEEVLRA